MDTGRDITDLLNGAAMQYGFDAVDFLGGAIAESNIREHSARNGQWPDVSFGLFHPAVKWIGPEADPIERAGIPPTAIDNVFNRTRVRDLSWDAAWSIAYVAPRYAALLKKYDNDPLEAWCRWNKPAIPGNLNPNRANYERGLREAEEYRMGATVGPGIKAKMDEAGDEAITNEWTETVGGAKIVRAYGKKGLYIASDDSGDWQTAGPLPLAE